MAALFLMVNTPALGHGEWAWIQKYNNANGTNCCSATDAVPITHEIANSAAVGTVVLVPFPNGPIPVEVNRIYPTEDPKGRPWITKYGCLFRWSGG